MTVLRCTAKLLKRLRQPAKLPEPPPADNPLGEWYADVDSIDREPFVLLLNAATGAALVLPGRVADLRDLHVHAGQQLFKLFAHYGFDLDAPRVGAELRAWDAPPTYANTRDRSLLGSMNRFKDEAWHHFAQINRSLPEAAARQWDGLFKHPALGRNKRFSMEYHRPLDLVQARLTTPGALQSESPTLH